jgi:hypothetical protein
MSEREPVEWDGRVIGYVCEEYKMDDRYSSWTWWWAYDADGQIIGTPVATRDDAIDVVRRATRDE